MCRKACFAKLLGKTIKKLSRPQLILHAQACEKYHCLRHLCKIYAGAGVIRNNDIFMKKICISGCFSTLLMLILGCYYVCKKPSRISLRWLPYQHDKSSFPVIVQELNFTSPTKRTENKNSKPVLINSFSFAFLEQVFYVSVQFGEESWRPLHFCKLFPVLRRSISLWISKTFDF